jgi:antitoxin ParD1/3/4
MAAAEKRTSSLPREQASYIDQLVASGRYATSSEEIRAGLRALQERDEAIERWLRDEVVSVALLMQGEPERGIPLDQIFDEIKALNMDPLKCLGRLDEDT